MIKLMVHATHEAGRKVGGIGAVLDGLLSAARYNQAVARTILVGVMNRYDALLVERLLWPHNGIEILYAPVFGFAGQVAADLAARLSAVEQEYGVALFYGERRFGQASHEVLLVDSIHAREAPVNDFKYSVWQHYGIDSGRYDYDLEYKDFMRSAPASFAALRSLAGPGEGAPGQPDDGRFILAHEWMGLPLVFAAQLSDPWNWRTVYYAHEMPTARRLVEFDGGHDTRFYNALQAAERYGLALEDVFGDWSHFYKHALVEQAVRCDNIFAVGEPVEKELRFLGGFFRSANIDLVYNGAPAGQITLQEKLASKARLQAYAQNLLGVRPDYIFTHVTRLVLSKALWRDVRLAEHLDGLLDQRGQSAVLFMLTTWAPAGRRGEDVWRWERDYGWPVFHRSDNGDLLDLEITLYNGIAAFNWQSRALKIVLVNQFGWDREHCGRRMPVEMEFMDIRRGSDLEFGQSIYEPFGIAQVEPLSFGALCVPSNVCGCLGFIERAAHEVLPATADDRGHLASLLNVAVADYTTLPPAYRVSSPQDALNIGSSTRDLIEAANSSQVARQIMARLPADHAAMQRLLEVGQQIGKRMSWDVVVTDYLLPGLRRASGR